MKVSDDEKNQHSSKLIALFLFSAFITIFLLRGIISVSDYDLWGNVRFGQDILKEGCIPNTDSYSYFSDGAKWINHEWLAEGIFALLYNCLGSYGLIALKTVVLLALAALLWRSLRQDGFGTTSASLFMILMGIFPAAVFQTIRAHIFTYLLFTLELLILKSFSTTTNSKKPRLSILLLVPIFVLWSNLHGGFVLGLIIFSVWFVCFLIELKIRSKSRNGKALACTAATAYGLSLAATLINPYGSNLLGLILSTATTPRPDITEWQPLGLGGVYGFCYSITVVFALLAFLFSKKVKSLDTLIIWALLVYAPQTAIRHLPFLGIATIVLAGPHILNCWDQISAFLQNNQSAKIAFWIALGLIVSLSACLQLLPIVITEAPLGQIPIYQKMPIRPVRILKSLHSRANLLTFFSWGEYCTWHLVPPMKIGIDGRRETVYPVKTKLKLYLTFCEGLPGWDKILTLYPTDLILIQPDIPVVPLLSKRTEWHEIYRDTDTVLFANSKWEAQKKFIHLDKLNAFPSSGREYFP